MRGNYGIIIESLLEGRGKGYIGKSMSVNAHNAYIDGEMPLSKWTKSILVDSIKDYIEDKGLSLDITKISKLAVKTLRDKFLTRSSWHHTGALYNTTDFYSLDTEYLDTLENDEIDLMLGDKKPKAKRSKEAIEQEKQEKAQRKSEKELKQEKEILFHYQTKYKSLGGFMRNTNVDLDALRRVRAEAIEKKRAELKNQWQKQNYTLGLNNLKDDEFVERYILK